MNPDPKIDRRNFLAAAGSGLLAAGTWLAGCSKQDEPVKAAKKIALDERFTYDVSQFEHTDPKLLLHSETGCFPVDFDEPKRLCVGPGDVIFVGGDRAVKRFDSTGTLQATIALPALPQALAATEDGRLFIALKNHFEIYDRTGARIHVGESFGEKSHLTGIAPTEDAVFLADAANREIIRCQPDGKPVIRFGKAAGKDGNPGFVVPSPYFTLMIGADGLLWVNNPGRHRVEAYTLDGKFELSWGATSMGPEGFCGCCNPVYFTRLRDGKFITSEKGLNRIKLHDAQGKFLGVVAGPEHLVKDLELAKKACTNCQIGFGFDVAVDSQSRVLTLDPATRQVRIFTAKSA